MLTTAVKIKIELLKAGITGAAIARRLGVDRSAVSHTIAGRKRSARIRRAIAEAVGQPVSELWPEEDHRVA